MAIINSKSPVENKESNPEELLGRVAGGDVEALAGLYDKFAPKLMGLLVRIMPTKPAAESALQEVFLRLWKEAAGIAESKGSLAAWLVLTARSAALQHLHRQRNEGGKSFPAAVQQACLPSPKEIALVDARLPLLQRAFSQIPKQQRGPLELAVFGGYVEAEIAEQLGEPLGKVKAALRAAFTFMRHRQHAVLGTWTADI
jgi:RNA polymerase sigma-70 factor (ECF subfamily)